MCLNLFIIFISNRELFSFNDLIHYVERDAYESKKWDIHWQLEKTIVPIMTPNFFLETDEYERKQTLKQCDIKCYFNE